MDTWGMLPKAQDNPQTIDEAIAAAFAAHEADTNAHIEEGESLYEHKHSEIIDHLAFSVVRDKINFDRYSVDTPTTGLLPAFNTGGYSDEGFDLRVIYPNDSGTFESGFYCTMGTLLGYFPVMKQSPVWQTSLFAETWNDVEFRIGMWRTGPERGVGFLFLEGDCYVFWQGADGVEDTEFIASLSNEDQYTLNMRYDYPTETMRYYINGALVHTQEVTFDEFNIPFYRCLYTYNGVYGGFIGLSSFHFDCDSTIIP